MLSPSGSQAMTLIGIEQIANPLFWQILDPTGENPDFQLHFINTLERTLSKYNEKLRDKMKSELGKALPWPAESSVIWIDSSDWNDFLKDLSAGLDNPEDLSPQSTEHNFITTQKDVFAAGFKLESPKQESFESLISTDEFKNYYITDKQDNWPIELRKNFLAHFFQDIKDPDQTSIHKDFDGEIVVRLSLGAKSFSLDEILQANGYAMRTLGAFSNASQDKPEKTEIAAFKIVEMGLIHQNILSYPMQQVLDLEPVNEVERERVLEIFSHYPGSINDLSLIGFLCRNDLYSHLLENEPWLREVLLQLGEDANQDMANFAKDYMTGVDLMQNRAVTSLQDSSGDYGDVNAYLYALRRSQNPKAALVLLFYLASIPGPLGKKFLKTIPLVLSQIEYEGEFGEEMKNGRVVVGASKRALGNAWISWNQEQLTEAAARLSEIPNQPYVKYEDGYETEYPGLFQLIGGLDYPHYDLSMHYIQNYFVAERINLHEVDSIPESGIPSSVKEGDLVSLKMLTCILRLDSTKEKVQILDVRRTGEIPIKDIINLDLTGPEREDLRLALKRYFLFQGENKIGDLQWESTLSSDTLEMLSTKVIVGLITHGDISSRASLWQALFSPP